MANNRRKRLRPAAIQDDRDAFAALKAIADYNPSNPDFTLAKVEAAIDAMHNEQTIEIQKNAAADAQRDKAVESESAAHDIVRGMKTQVKAQFGENSDEYASLGMKKKDEYNLGRKVKKTVEPV